MLGLYQINYRVFKHFISLAVFEKSYTTFAIRPQVLKTLLSSSFLDRSSAIAQFLFNLGLAYDVLKPKRSV